MICIVVWQLASEISKYSLCIVLVKNPNTYKYQTIDSILYSIILVFQKNIPPQDILKKKII